MIIRILTVIILVLIFVFAFIFSISDKPIPTERPFVYKGVLYLNLKEIPLEKIVKIEFVTDPIVYVIIQYDTGFYSLPLKDYLKIREDLWYWEYFK